MPSSRRSCNGWKMVAKRLGNVCEYGSCVQHRCATKERTSDKYSSAKADPSASQYSSLCSCDAPSTLRQTSSEKPSRDKTFQFWRVARMRCTGIRASPLPRLAYQIPACSGSACDLHISSNSLRRGREALQIIRKRFWKSLSAISSTATASVFCLLRHNALRFSASDPPFRFVAASASASASPPLRVLIFRLLAQLIIHGHSLNVRQCVPRQSPVAV